MQYKDVCKTFELNTAILLDLNDIASQNSLLPYEQVYRIHIETNPWTVDNFLTATVKMQRFKLRQNYKSILDELLPKNII